MIHYHGTPISGDAQGMARFLVGRHALVSFAYPAAVSVVADACQSFVLDNGAFTAWRQGKPLDVTGYMRWVHQWCLHPGFDWALIPDVIDGTEEENDKLLARWCNFGLKRYGVPVWHMHESIDRLQKLCMDWRIVALGSSGEWPNPGAHKWWDRMTEAMEAICDVDGRPPCKLHGLRMLDPRVFSDLPLASADSTNAGVNAGSVSRFGSYTPPSAYQRAAVIADRIEAVNSAPCWIKRTADQEDLFLCSQ